MTPQTEAISETVSTPNPVATTQRVRLEVLATVLATGLVALVFFLITLNAGPLWRDETNTINIAQMPSLKVLWRYAQFESFPPLYVLVLRAWGFLGMAGTDGSIRVLGLLIGLLFLGSLWLCSKWVWRGAPTLSVALLGSLPAVVFTVTSTRAYGLSACLLILTFATVWRVLELPSKSRILLAAGVCFLFAHCVYYNAICLGAILLGAAVIVVRRRQWRLLAVFAGIGAGSVASVTIYLPTVRRASAFMPMFQAPQFDFGFLLMVLNQAISFHSTAHPAVPSGFQAGLWVGLVVMAVGIGVGVQSGRFRLPHQMQESVSVPAGPAETRVADLALFGVIALVGGVVGHLGFLVRLHYSTQSWYYVGMLTLCAICLESVFEVTLRAWRPWGLIRVGFLIAIMAWGWKGIWEEAHSRRSNVDVIAAVLEKKAASRDLIVVQSAWEGITFGRYYHGQAKWQTLPPIPSHEVHRLDLVWPMLNTTNSIAPVLAQALDTLQKGGAVWVVGQFGIGSRDTLASALPLPPALPTRWWLGPYFSHWGAQLTALLAATATDTQHLETPISMPVNWFENLPVLRFSGYRLGTE
ncbi:MAG TPA: hypothetical protein VNZ64_21595 [Candidatus Acidoferrum sp.]|nr:hypothetical protein [Candidatus Acidoferrum sp.]